jgi:hypothetical protein
VKPLRRRRFRIGRLHHDEENSVDDDEVARTLSNGRPLHRIRSVRLACTPSKQQVLERSTGRGRSSRRVAPCSQGRVDCETRLVVGSAEPPAAAASRGGGADCGRGSRQQPRVPLLRAERRRRFGGRVRGKPGRHGLRADGGALLRCVPLSGISTQSRAFHSPILVQTRSTEVPKFWSDRTCETRRKARPSIGIAMVPCRSIPSTTQRRSSTTLCCSRFSPSLFPI